MGWRSRECDRASRFHFGFKEAYARILIRSVDDFTKSCERFPEYVYATKIEIRASGKNVSIRQRPRANGV